jgi:hypothetical protein
MSLLEWQESPTELIAALRQLAGNFCGRSRVPHIQESFPFLLPRQPPTHAIPTCIGFNQDSSQQQNSSNYPTRKSRFMSDTAFLTCKFN